MAELESKNVACPPIRRYTSSAVKQYQLRVIPPFLKAAVGSKSGGSCKLRLFTLASSPYQGEDFLLFGLLLILFPDLHLKSTIFREVT